MFTSRLNRQLNLIFYVLKRLWHRVHKKDQIRTGNPRRIRSIILSLYQRLWQRVNQEKDDTHQFLYLLKFTTSAKQHSLTDFEVPSSKPRSGESQDQGPNEEEESDEADGTAIIYARVSSQKQAREGHSLDTQVEQLKRIAEQEGLSLHCDPIRDEAQTGGSFERDGIQRVFREAQKDAPSYLLVQDVDRIGRAAAETLYFIYILQSECDVTLITQSGEKDVSSTRGLMQTTLMSLMAQLNNELRMRKAKESAVRSFIENKNWSAYKPVTPLGYEKTDDGWVKKQPEMEPVVQDLFDEFLDCETYQETKRRLEEKYGDVLDGHRVKTLLQEPAYKGKPQVSANSVGNYEGKRVRDDPELQFVHGERFEKAQRVIEAKNEQYSSEDTGGLAEFIEEFDLFTVVESSPPVELRCESCEGQMVKNGQRSLSGASVDGHMYRCTECGKSRKWPRDDDYNRMELLQKLPDLPALLDRLTN
ncbi:recombinase family protein [Halobacterium sp. KA-4]|uniref:recombinase family protein n=1 Tax=Halobacterium sp. KA-4 TaxID=2896367 RepID=UPI001E4454CE|nr:recombinase family protein [Halobacterium sp. KA-4]MCD2200804.1 recombinase family protein [Halobacterium sp. KA-4]